MDTERNLELEAERFGEMLEQIDIFTADEEFKEAFSSNKIIRAATIIFKKHPKEAVKFIIAYEGTTRETTDMNRKNMLGKLIAIFNDEEIKATFTSAE